MWLTKPLNLRGYVLIWFNYLIGYWKVYAFFLFNYDILYIKVIVYTKCMSRVINFCGKIEHLDNVTFLMQRCDAFDISLKKKKRGWEEMLRKGRIVIQIELNSYLIRRDAWN